MGLFFIDPAYRIYVREMLVYTRVILVHRGQFVVFVLYIPTSFLENIVLQFHMLLEGEFLKMSNTVKEQRGLGI